MPPKRGRANAGKRGEETQRLPGDEWATAAATTALDRRPHHLVSRLHPPWNAPGSTNGNAGVNHHPPLLPTSSGTAASKATAAPHVRGRGGMSTRVAGRSAAVQKDDRVNTVALKATPTTTAGKCTTTTRSAGRKRSRSVSASNPIEVDAEDSAEEKDERNDHAAEHGGNDDDDDVSPSPLPMVAESKVLRSGGVGGSAAQMRRGADDKNGKPPQDKHTAATVTMMESASSSAKGEVTPVTPGKLPPHNTATSTADSKVLFGDDDDNEESATEDRVVWPSQGGAPTQDTAAALDGVSPPPDRQQETHVLGELSDRTSVTPARPTRTPATKKTAPLTKVFMAEEDEDDESELLGEMPHSSQVAIHASYRTVQEQNTVPPQPIGEEAENQTASTGPATPSLLPAHDSVSPDADVAGAVSAAAHFAETLAVQDLSFLPDESANVTTQGEALPILPSSTELHTPHAGLAVDPSRRNLATVAGDAREVLLGDGLVSPPVKRATVTPQQAAESARGAVTGETAEDGKDGKSAPPAAARELCPPPPLLARLSPSITTTTTTTDSSLLTPHTPAEAAVDAVGGRTAATTAETTAACPPLISSLPSTLDDGCWKDDAPTPLRTPPPSLAAAGPHDGADSNSSVAQAATSAVAAVAASALLQETVPIDPFLHTPPQFRQDRSRQPQTDVLSEGSEVTPERATTTAGKKASGRSPHRSGGGGRSGRSASKSRTPPRAAPTPSTATNADRSGTTTNVVNGVEVDPAALLVGTQVEGRWGRQWFPATVSEAPRNGFVQIEWREDGSLLHVRLREVRLPVKAPLPVGTDATGSKRKGEANPAAAAAEETATERTDKEGDVGGAVLTATQLVALMEKEDAEDSRHEVESHDTPRGSANAVAAADAHKTATASPRGPKRNDIEESDVEAVVEAEGTGRRRKRGKSSTPPPPPPEKASSSSTSSPSGVPPPTSPAPPGSALPDGTTTTEPNLPEQETIPLPFETTPAALCIYLAPSVRRDLLQGLCNPAGGVAASTEVKRNTELQRVLHYLTSAGATLISSLAQADNVAAQLGDDGSITATSPQRGPMMSDAERHTEFADRSSSSLPSANGNGSVAAARRKTVGRVPLPRKSGVGSTPGTAAPARRYFIFLVSSSSSSSASFLSASASTAPAGGDDALRHLPDVCVAHAFGVSAIHASWLWSVVPGALHVRLPTAQDQVTLPLELTSAVVSETSLQKRDTASPTLPLRLMPFPTRRRWLSGTAVEFVQRDDMMEVWLNAAGAVVTAEPPPPPPPPQASSPSNAGAVQEGGTGDSSKSDSLAALAAARRRSVSPARHVVTPPLRKQPCVERQPDLVYVREMSSTVPVDLARLGSIPVLRLPWLAKGVERNYRARCRGGGGSTEEKEVSESEEMEAGEGPPPVLSSVWEEMQRTAAAARSQSHRERSITPTVSTSGLKSPSVPRNVPGQTTTAEDAPAKAVTNSAAATSPGESAALGTNEEEQNTHPPAVVDGNMRPFDMRSPDAKDPTTHESATPVAGTGAAATSSPPPAVTIAAKSEGDDANGCREQDERRQHGLLAADVENEEAPPSHPIDEDKQGVNAEAVPLRDSAPLLQPPQLLACNHPSISAGEDYYFSIAVPSTASTLAGSTPLQHTPSTQMPVPSATIALGRVVALQQNSQGLVADLRSLHHEAQDGATLSSPLCCFAVMQLYEIKYVSMHVDPRAGEVIHQTTLYLSPQRITVPAASLLFDVPVYVITAASRQHVYLLEEEQETVPTSTPFSRPMTTVPTVDHRGESVNEQTDVSVLQHLPRDGLVDAYRTPAFPASPRLHESATLSASPAPTSPLPRRQPTHFLRGTRSGDPVAEVNTAVQQWTMNVADCLHSSPSQGIVTVSPLKVTEATPRQSNTSTVHNEAKRDSDDALSSSVPRTLDVAELEDRSPHSAVAARHAVQGVRDTSSLRRVSLGNAPRPARMLTQLQLEVGGKAVVLRPTSHVSFYARRSTSMSERPSSVSAQRGSQPHRADSSSDVPQNSGKETGQAASITSTPQHHSEYAGDDKSDSSEELIAEAPMVGRVEMMREMDGVVDIVVHTAQPNSVFGGSKMYRVTPDMIVDVSP